MTTPSHRHSTEGFTLIELVVAILLATIFLGSILSLSMTVTQLSISGSQRNVADLQAYANLREFANGAPATWYTSCPGTPPFTQTLLNTNDPVEKLPPNVTQRVVATAPYGCAAPNYVIKVTSTVTYGPQNRSVTHAVYTAK